MNPIFKEHFNLEFLRLKRHIQATGLHPIRVLILILTLVLFTVVYAHSLSDDSTLIFIYLSTILIIWKASIKSRKQFYSLIYQRKEHRIILLLENLILTSPFWAVKILTLNFIETAFILSISGIFFIVDSISFRMHSKLTIPVIPTIFKHSPHEFTVGFRRTFPLYIFILGVLTKAWQVENFNLGIATLAISVLLCSSFYSKHEPAYFLCIQSRNAKNFIHHKLIQAIKNSFILSLPCLSCLVLWDARMWWFILLIFCACLLFVLTSVVTKYSTYPTEFNLSQTILLVICLLLAPIMLVVFPWHYMKAINNLKPLLS